MSKVIACAIVLSLSMADAADAQEHDHAKMLRDMAAASGWQLMQDGAVFLMLNDQGGQRGGTEAVAPNWWMGMASRKTSRGTVSLSGMLSLDPATVGSAGYRELFQAGESYHGQPVVDGQHPHDLFMELSASWRVGMSSSTSLTLTGGAIGAPALGPVAFMHRASAFDNPMAPLTHHLLDSTHVSFGVASAAIEHGPWTVEGSVFNGREPDEHRWDFDFGPMNSVSGRVWFKPDAQWAFQVSTGHLVSPEVLEPGNIQRTTASASWTRVSGSSIDAVTAGFGHNDTTYDRPRSGAFVEGTHHAGANTVYGRVEVTQLDHAIADVNVGAFTLGGVRDILSSNGVETGVGAAVTFYATPALLDASYGPHPMSFQVFVRLRSARHMVNMR